MLAIDRLKTIEDMLSKNRSVPDEYSRIIEENKIEVI